MKPNIHPTMVKSRITCACGNVIMTESLESEIPIEICSACHPFFTGKQKLIDTARRVEKFQEKVEKAKQFKPKSPKKKKLRKEPSKTSLRLQ